MARVERYKGYTINSSPYRLALEEKHNFSVNGTITIDRGGHIDDILVDKLDIPNIEYQQDTEEAAEQVFIDYAKKFIDNL